MSYQEERVFGDKFMPQVKRIVGELMLDVAPVVEDQKRCTDLIVLNMREVRIGCRIRRHSYLKKYGDEFTLRYKSKTGAETEFTKILKGWGDYLFYAFANEEETDLFQWTIINLYSFRIGFHRMAHGLERGKHPGEVVPNQDKTLGLAFKYSQFEGITNGEPIIYQCNWGEPSVIAPF